MSRITVHQGPLPVSQRYQLGRLLGQGGMGAVYQALDRLTGQSVALKSIALRSLPQGAHGDGSSTAPLVPDPDALTLDVPGSATQRLRGGGTGSQTELGADPGTADELQAQRLSLAQEFHTLAALRHPHIISVLDYGFDTQQAPFFTMELLHDAQPLREAAVGRPLPEQVALLAQVAQALSYLHRHGVIHRDLKPGKVTIGRACL